jgi:hypothetical protein
MKDVAVVGYCRTGIAKAGRGALNQTHGIPLVAHVLRQVVERASIVNRLFQQPASSSSNVGPIPRTAATPGFVASKSSSAARKLVRSVGPSLRNSSRVTRVLRRAGWRTRSEAGH